MNESVINYVNNKTVASREATDLVYAFDIETGGATYSHPVLSIGATVLDNKYTLLDKKKFNGFGVKDLDQEKEMALLEKRCIDEFLSQFPEVLSSSRVDETFEQAQRNMIVSFIQNRDMWQKYADENKLKFHLVSDNAIFDGGFVNSLITKYIPDKLSLVYNYKKKYSSVKDVNDISKGLEWCKPKFLSTFKFQKCQVSHDHNCANDAHTIAHRYVNLLSIREIL